MDLLVSLADVYFRAGDTKNAILKFEQAQMLDPYLIKGDLKKQTNPVVIVTVDPSSRAFSFDDFHPRNGRLWILDGS